MTEDAKKPAAPKPPSDRQERLAAALRANLRKRKEQARQREQDKDGEGG